jgi:hypothetical protein
MRPLYIVVELDGLSVSFSILNSKRPELSASLAYRLSGLDTSARGMGERVTELMTVPEIVLLDESEDESCA